MKTKYVVSSIAVIALAAGCNVEQLPACGSDQVKSMVVQIVNEQLRNPLAAMALGNVRVFSVEESKELHKDPVRRACVADTKHSNGIGEVGYVIELTNKEKGEFIVQVYPAAQVRSEFKAETEAKQPAKESPVQSQGAVETKETADQNKPEDKPEEQKQVAQEKQQDPSFDCSKSSNDTERTICATPKLATMDSLFAQNYKGVIATLMSPDFNASAAKNIKSGQSAWLSKRNACGDDALCIAKEYESRNNEICDFGVPTGVHPCFNTISAE